jgi:periplasmic protein TonB
MRADAVSLEVPVRVHGSRVDDSPSGATPKSEAFEEQTSTMIVFPQGGVLKMATPVTAGQMMVVTNLKSGHDSICRVVKVRAYGQGQSYVEIEFTHRQPGYWGVYFPSDGPDPASQASPLPPAAPSTPPISLELKVEKTAEKSTADASAPVPASTLKPPVTKPAGPPSKEDSVFAPIGSQEQVQPAASATSSRVKSISDVESKQLDFGSAVKSPRMDSLESSSPAASVSIGELQGDVEGASAVSFAGAGVPGEVAEAAPPENGRSANHPAPFGQLAATATLTGGHPSAREPFGSTLGSSSLAMGGRAPESGLSRVNHGMAITVTAAVLVAAAAGATYYFRLLPFGSKSAAKPQPAISAPAESPSATTAAPANLAPQPVNPTPNPQPNSLAGPGGASASSVASAPSVRGNAIAALPPRSSKPLTATAPSEAEPTPAEAPSTQNLSPKVPDMFGALNAHPTSRAYSSDSGQTDAAPAVDAPAAETGEGGLSAIDASSAIAPPSAEPQAPVRIRVGGELKPPRLVSSVLPVYPPVARDAGIEGDVVIDTTIDKTGRVTSTKVVSGPAVLRGPALDALRQWKYVPSKLNGEPVAVQMTVTIRFHRQ